MDQEEKNRKEHAKIRAAKETPRMPDEIQRIWDSLSGKQKATAMNVYTEYYNKTCNEKKVYKRDEALP
jgi:hypothetical protein|tara:strand:+ start:2087 stop:2290 length:204 start_codon:yes stop_codon:yes gene_type:complete